MRKENTQAKTQLLQHFGDNYSLQNINFSQLHYFHFFTITIAIVAII